MELTMARSSTCSGNGAAACCAEEITRPSGRESGEYPSLPPESGESSDDFELSCDSAGTLVIYPSAAGGRYGTSPAITAEERRAVFSMRYYEYCHVIKAFSPAKYPNQLESDRFDEQAVLFIGTMDGLPVGTIRLAFEKQGQFPMETGKEGVALPDWLPRDTTCEPSRLVGRVIQDHEHGIVQQSLLLIEVAFKWTIAHGYTHWVCNLQTKYYHFLKQSGWPFIILGPEQTYYGTNVTPVALVIREVYEKVYAK